MGLLAARYLAKDNKQHEFCRLRIKSKQAKQIRNANVWKEINAHCCQWFALIPTMY